MEKYAKYYTIPVLVITFKTSRYVFHNMYVKLKRKNKYYDVVILFIMEINVDGRREKERVGCGLCEWDTADMWEDVVGYGVEWRGFRTRVVDLKQVAEIVWARK